MPSVALRRWATLRAAALDEIEAAHAAVGGTGPGRRHATRQLNHAYAVLLAAEFQGFCRELHGECATLVVAAVPPALRVLVDRLLRSGRQLDRANATPATLGADFGRLALDFWPTLTAYDPRTADWQRGLVLLNEWRNAIAHNDFDPARLGGTIVLRLARVRHLRGTCRRLARAFDEMLRRHLLALTGRSPW